jgi:hypothetical protein
MRWWLTCALLAGCIGGQTGQESEGADPCAQSSPVLDDEVTPIGTSAKQIATALAGPFEAPLVWHLRNARTQITVALAYAGGSARYVSGGCPGELQLDATVTLATDDGLLDERATGTLHATAADRGQLLADIDLAALAGSYDASEFDLRNWREPKLGIVVQFTGSDSSGTLSIDGDDPMPNDDREPTSGAAASWPAR